ncbi:MAG: hypothetical protein MOB07_19630 [Acidobacteria bacterium]|nr:hypothetical protein [Acidobacteriota bacterium]
MTLFDVSALACVGTSWPAWLPMAMLFNRVLIGSDADDGGDEMAAEFAAECKPYTRRIERLSPEGAKDWA